jgi:hypothetical protein
MNQSHWRVISVALAAGVLVLGYDMVSFAATGSSLILGHRNTAGSLTTVKRTTSGPALKLATKHGSPPLVVTSGKKVKHLNADKVDGAGLSKLEPAATVYSVAETGDIGTDAGFWLLPSGLSGPYRVEINAEIHSSDASDTWGYCGLGNVSDQGNIMGNTAPLDDGTGTSASVSATKIIAFDPAKSYALVCAVASGNAVIDYAPSVALTPVRKVSDGGDLTWSP